MYTIIDDHVIPGRGHVLTLDKEFQHHDSDMVQIRNREFRFGIAYDAPRLLTIIDLPETDYVKGELMYVS